MKNYWKGSLVLVSIMMTLIFFMFKFHWYLKESQNELVQLKSVSESSKSSYDQLNKDLLAHRLMMENMSGFLQSWEPFLLNSTDANKVLNEIVELSFSNALAVVEKTAQRRRENEKGILRESIIIALKVVGKFERIYNWLGAVEKVYPHAKINELDLTAENMNAALSLSFELPIMI